VEEIKATNERKIELRTIIGYIAENAAMQPHGGRVDFARLASEAGVTYETAAALCKGTKQHCIWPPAALL